MFSVHFISSLWWKLFNSPISLETLHKSNGGRLGIRNQLKFAVSPIPTASLRGGQHQHQHDLMIFPISNGTVDITTNPSLQNVPTDSGELPYIEISFNMEPKGF